MPTKSYDQLEPKLDAFADAMVDIENVIGGTGGAGGGSAGGIPGPHTFYFKIPSNPKLLGYWTTVADRLTSCGTARTSPVRRSSSPCSMPRSIPAC